MMGFQLRRDRDQAKLVYLVNGTAVANRSFIRPDCSARMHLSGPWRAPCREPAATALLWGPCHSKAPAYLKESHGFQDSLGQCDCSLSLRLDIRVLALHGLGYATTRVSCPLCSVPELASGQVGNVGPLPWVPKWRGAFCPVQRAPPPHLPVRPPTDVRHKPSDSADKVPPPCL